MISQRAKEMIVRSPLHKSMLIIRSWIEEVRIRRVRGIAGGTKAYCISPYKTGTTYVCGLFSEGNRVAHEPFHHTTLRRLSDSAFLEKRAGYLSLDLESSGFFSNRLLQLRMFAPSVPVLFMCRSPEAWIGSVINYFAQLDKQVHYNYVSRLFFDPICRFAVERFYEMSADGQRHIVQSLLGFWLDVYETAKRDPGAMIVPLEQLSDKLQSVEDFLGLKARRLGAWQRSNKTKQTFVLSDHIDPLPYRQRVAAIGYSV